MEFRHLGWAGVELRDAGSTLVIDPLEDPAAVWAWAGEQARDVPMPELVAADPGAAAALVTHLHRDHADAAALSAAVGAGGAVLLPSGYGGGEAEEAAVAEASADLDASDLVVRDMAAWDRVTIDGWEITALPAADGLGDPQLSWLVSRGDQAIVHGGDTLWHGWWWRVAERARGRIDVAFLPVNGARVRFPNRRPASPTRAAMNAADAVAAATVMRARTLVPIHYGAYHFPPVYVPDPDPLDRLLEVAGSKNFEVVVPPLGEWTEVPA